MFSWIIDEMHPSRTNKIDNLTEVCRQLKQPLLRLEQPSQVLRNIESIDCVGGLHDLLDSNERILLLSGLEDLAYMYSQFDLPCFALVSPDPLSLQLDLSVGFPTNHLGCLLPLPDTTIRNHYLEYALCKHWEITVLIFCQSGCPTEELLELLK